MGEISTEELLALLKKRSKDDPALLKRVGQLHEDFKAGQETGVVEAENGGIAVGAMNNTNAIGGNNNLVIRIDSVVFAADRDEAPEARQLLRDYLTGLAYETGLLELGGIDPKAITGTESAPLQLASVYTDLDVVASADQDRHQGMGGNDRLMAERHKPRLALDFVACHPLVALVGDPGSGKTTLTNFLVLCLAGEILAREDVNLQRLGKAWTVGAILPVRVVLRQFAALLPDLACENVLWDYMPKA